MKVMKTIALVLVITTAAALAAAVINFAVGATLLFAAGFAAIAVHDYTRPARTLKLPATVALGARVEKFGLAA